MNDRKGAPRSEKLPVGQPDPAVQERYTLGQERIVARSQALQIAAQVFHGTGKIKETLEAARTIEAEIWASAEATRRMRAEFAGLTEGAARVQH